MVRGVRQAQVEHGMCVSLSQSCPPNDFSPNVRAGLLKLEIVNTGWVGIFHLCESYSFYFHKNKVEKSDSKQSRTLNT